MSDTDVPTGNDDEQCTSMKEKEELEPFRPWIF